MIQVFTQSSVISAYLKTLLETVTIANGFQTDIGTTVYAGRRNVDDDQPPCTALVEGEDKPGDNTARDAIKIEIDYAAVAYMPCDPDNPNDAAHLAIKDMKKVLFQDGPRLGNRVGGISYLGRDIGPRADGKAIVMAVVHFRITFAETLVDA